MGDWSGRWDGRWYGAWYGRQSPARNWFGRWFNAWAGRWWGPVPRLQSELSASIDATLPMLSFEAEATVPRRRGGGRAHEDVPIWTRLRPRIRKPVEVRLAAVLPLFTVEVTGAAQAPAEMAGDQPVSSPQAAEVPVPAIIDAPKRPGIVRAPVRLPAPARVRVPAPAPMRPITRTGSATATLPALGMMADARYDMHSDEEVQDILDVLDLAA